MGIESNHFKESEFQNCLLFSLFRVFAMLPMSV